MITHKQQHGEKHCCLVLPQRAQSTQRKPFGPSLHPLRSLRPLRALGELWAITDRRVLSF